MISVIIPTLNPSHVRPLIIAIKMNILPLPHEIIIETEIGYLKAVASGLHKAKGDIIVIMDGDGSHNPVHFRKMFTLLKKADIIIGSRYVTGGYSNDLFARRIVSRFFCKVARALLGFRDIADVMSGFIIVKKTTLNGIKLNSFGYKIGLSILTQAKGKFRIVEYPIVFEKSHIHDYVKLRNVKDGIQTVTFIVKLFIYRMLRVNV